MFSLLNMSTLFERLCEVCRDQGVENPRPKDISSICKLSSGRPKQIMDRGEAARLGADTLQHLSSMGYSIAWLQNGKLPKFSGSQPRELRNQAKQTQSEYSSEPLSLSEQEIVLLKWFRSKTSEEQEIFFGLIGIKLHTDFAQSA